jgi:hypothetical protein
MVSEIEEEDKEKIIKVRALLKKEKVERYREWAEEDWRVLRMRSVGSVEDV